MDNTPATPDTYSAVDLGKDTRSVLKGLSGMIALGIGASALVLGSGGAFLFAGLALYTGGRQVFEAGKELLPLKIQSGLSAIFTGKPLTEITPVKQPTTPLGKIFRAVEYVNLAVTGAAAFAFGGFVIGMGGQGQGIAAMTLGGLAMATSGLVNTGAQIVKGIRALVRAQKDATSAPDVTKVAPAPEPAPALAAKASAPSFNQSATPDATPAAAPSTEQPKPATPQPPTV